jgi:hypothetical protein
VASPQVSSSPMESPAPTAIRRGDAFDPAANPNAGQLAQGSIRPRLWVCSAQGLCAGGGNLSRLPAPISERSSRPGGAILAGRESLSAAAVSGRCRIVSRRLHQIRDHGAGAGGVTAARPVARQFG